jgi:hypothetical protein
VIDWILTGENPPPFFRSGARMLFLIFGLHSPRFRGWGFKKKVFGMFRAT